MPAHLVWYLVSGNMEHPVFELAFRFMPKISMQIHFFDIYGIQDPYCRGDSHRRRHRAIDNQVWFQIFSLSSIESCKGIPYVSFNKTGTSTVGTVENHVDSIIDVFKTIMQQSNALLVEWKR
ncbi:hypothetical protein V6N13_081451 [Hibiscus sabdariffa]